MSYSSVSKNGLSLLTLKCKRLKHLVLKYCEEVSGIVPVGGARRVWL